MSAPAGSPRLISAELYLSRHGETDWNAEGRIQGQMDIPLNALGRAQAKRNGETLAGLLGPRIHDIAYIASPLARTVETMRIIRTAMGLSPDDFARDERLMELHFGDWQGFTLADIDARDHAAYRARKADKWNYVPGGAEAESYAMLEERMAPVFESIVGPTLVVAHGGIVRGVLRRFTGVSPREAAHMTIPQDRFLVFRDGEPSWV